MLRTLDEIEKDLYACAEYGANGTLQAGFRYMSDLRVNLLALTQHVKALRLETHPTKEELDLIVREVASMSNSDVVGAMELLRVRQRE